jgi:DNA polymerase-1
VDLSDVKASLHGGHESFETKTVHGLEADDVLGILATHPTLVKGEKIVVGIDKDLLQIPGFHYNFNKDSLRAVQPEAATRFFFTQVLTGDTTDGFPGCPGIGPKKAAGLFGAIDPDSLSIPDYWSVVVGAYARKGLSEEHALTQARVAKICLASDYDFTNKKVIPWTPKSS